MIRERAPGRRTGFIVDHNVGKLVRWLRMMGFDSLLFTGANDTDMVNRALAEDRTILTRDRGVAGRRVVNRGLVRVILFRTEEPEKQIKQLIDELGLTDDVRPFTRCIECNSILEDRTLQEVRDRVPPYVAHTQTSYRECPSCHRIYWPGTHWSAMTGQIERLTGKTIDERRSTMTVYETIRQRRSIRRFSSQAVSDAILDKCADAARLAPSGRNQQVCEFVTVNTPEMLQGMFGNIGGSIKLPPEKGGPAPGNEPRAYTIVLINKERESDASRRNISIYDAAMAAENVILTAVEEGLGCCPLLMFNREGVAKLLNIPEKYDIALVIAMGFPAESPVADIAEGAVDPVVDRDLVRHVPKRKLEDVLHRNGF